MKYRLFFLAVLPWFIHSCSDQRSAQQTAQAFLQSYYIDFDFAAAKAVSSPNTHNMIDWSIRLFHLNPPSKEHRFLNFEITQSDIKKTMATFNYNVDDVGRKLVLRKIDRKWLVDMSETTSHDPRFSLNPTRSRGGFASAESKPTRLGGSRSTTEKKDSVE